MARRILIVEDDDMVRESIALLLNYNGYDVMCNSTGLNITSQIEHFKPDLILLDIMLGELEGRDICKMLRQNTFTQSLPVLMVSGESYLYNTISDIGATDVVLKPFTEHTLISRIERYCPNSLSA